MLRVGLGSFIGQIDEELGRDVETGMPHPRKIKAAKATEMVARG